MEQTRLNSQIANSEQENARLQAEVERLRKAGWPLAELLHQLRCEGGDLYAIGKAIQQWQNATGCETTNE